ncbi:phospholipase C [Rhodoblastus sphagnicola]|uniref:alkaline phosphatase family protein n=1 Tax=Rhodoblastus sphagnicola TaxID=333368 RepID=UPI0011B0D4FB|nr:alkaline phosphatase family protein [Rhodoblastus sphagnicola]MBB4196401.1 phospholipase C [Rhodoblastus sphagnicola]
MRLKSYLKTFVCLSAVLIHALAPNLAYAAKHVKAATARTPIKHVIVIIGENRTFDHIFATYKPVNSNENVLNLLSQGIVNADGAPGPNYAKAAQYKATDTATYLNAPTKAGKYATLPPAVTGGPAAPYVCQAVGLTNVTSCATNAKALTLAESVQVGRRATIINIC